jgi:hypothetical protein
MNDLLDQTIKTALDNIVAHTPDLGPTPTEYLAVDDERPRFWPVLAAAAVVALVAVAGALALRSDPSSEIAVQTEDTTPPTGTNVSAEDTEVPAPEGLEPVETLPDTLDLTDVPLTVAPDGPRAWYRLQPDLDIAWQATTTGDTEFCWRTPIDTQCQPESGHDQLTVIPTAGAQTLVIVLGDASRQLLDIELTNGTTQSAPIAWDDQTGWGVARFQLPDGVDVTATGTSTSGDPEPDTVTGRTLPPAVDLTDVPLTVPAGSPLAYWRFLPDLDVSERATTTGGTELCWRTPAGTGCIDDTFESPNVGIIPADNATIFLVRPALIPIDPPPDDPLAPTTQLGPSPTTVTVTFSDGTTTTVEVRHGRFVGYARIDTPDGVTVVEAVSS